MDMGIDKSGAEKQSTKRLMAILSTKSLINAGVSPTQARTFIGPLLSACDRFDITTAVRLAGFIAQCRVESQDFTRLEENLRYRSPALLDQNFSAVKGLEDAAKLIAAGPVAIANRVYADRLGNGPETSGDGWRYRGRGLIQLTGRYNYMVAGDAIQKPYLIRPELLSKPDDACLTAAWFWHVGGCNELADASNWDAITLKINGKAKLGADLRTQYSEEGVRAFA